MMSKLPNLLFGFLISIKITFAILKTNKSAANVIPKYNMFSKVQNDFDSMMTVSNSMVFWFVGVLPIITSGRFTMYCCGMAFLNASNLINGIITDRIAVESK